MTHKTPLGCRNDFTELHHPGGDRPSMFSGLNVLEDRAKKKITFVFQYIHDTPKIRKQIKHTGDREDRVKMINTLLIQLDIFVNSYLKSAASCLAAEFVMSSNYNMTLFVQ